MKSLINELNFAKDRKYSKGLEENAFGTSESSVIIEVISKKVYQQIGSKPESLKFFAASAALVYGFVLAGGQEVVLKVFPPDWKKDNLKISREIQGQLFESGYPITEPLGDVFEIAGTCATLDRYKEASPESELYSREYLKKLASGLYDLANLCSKFKVEKLPGSVDQFGWTDNERWGKQVRPEIDLDDNPEGAEWIEELGERARSMSASPSGRTVIAHDDWLPHNVRFGKDLSLEIVYDWDSLCRGLETVFVGKACLAARSEDIPFFIGEYEKAAGYKFNKDELRTLAGTALWMRAFLARWEHSQSKEPNGYLRDRLKSDAGILGKLTE